MNILDGFSKRTEKKKAAIIKATLELYQKYGIKKVSIADIARQAHVSPATIYNHFSTKENLTYEAVKDFMLGTINDLSDIINADKPFPEIIGNIVLAKSQRVSGINPELFSEILSSNPDIQKFYMDAFNNKMIPMWLDFLQRGKKQGYVKEELSQKSLLLYLDILQKGVTACQDAFANDPKRDVLTKELSQMFFYGILNQKDG